MAAPVPVSRSASATLWLCSPFQPSNRALFSPFAMKSKLTDKSFVHRCQTLTTTGNSAFWLKSPANQVAPRQLGLGSCYASGFGVDKERCEAREIGEVHAGFSHS